jgi:hypothetical protein
MLSYAWGCKKELVVALELSLRDMNYEVWRDETGSSIVPSMSGATDDCMAEAIEASCVVVVCVSPAYKESANCRMEAKYAGGRAKKGKLKFIFVMMDELYHTHSSNAIDGWLGFMVSSTNTSQTH